MDGEKWARVAPRRAVARPGRTTSKTENKSEKNVMHNSAPTLVRKISLHRRSGHDQSCAMPFGQRKSPSPLSVMNAVQQDISMDTITTIQSLLKLDGSAQSATVSLMPSERRLIAAAPALYEALCEVMLHLPDFAEDDQLGIIKACDMARAALAATQEPKP